MDRLKIVELTIMRHPPIGKAIRGLSSGPGFNGGKWRRLTTQNWYVTLTTTPEGER